MPTHVWFVQETGDPQLPVELHELCAVVLAHSACPGAQTPWHDAAVPITMHVWLAQGCGVPQVPVAPQVETPLLMHRVEPGAQLP